LLAIVACVARAADVPAQAKISRHDFERSDFVEQRVWTGLYDQNRLDGNAVIGNWHGRHDNVYVAAGFSGHAFMDALSVGCGLTEHLLTGAYRTVDLSRLGYARIEAEQPYAELGIR
jgi:FAD-dependent oxidoreductase domain-containing protein 1